MSSQPPPPLPRPPGADDTAPFTPIAPVPSYTQPTMPVRRSRGGGSGLGIALAVTALVLGCGLSFAAGRASASAAAVVGQDAATGQLGAGASADPNAGNANPTTPAGAGDNLPGPSALPSRNSEGGESGEGFGRGFGFGGPTIQGTIASVSGNSVSVRLANGATVTFGLGPSTAYHQQTPGSQADLAAGKTVILRISRFGSGQQGGGSLGTATDVTVVP